MRRTLFILLAAGLAAVAAGVGLYHWATLPTTLRVAVGPVGSEDTRLVMAWPEYENALKAAGVTYEGYIYPGAAHGFNNDATPARYNKAAADLAYKRTIDWFNKHVRGAART